MSERFLCLDASERAGILNTKAPELGLAPKVLEKDIWVCWTLRTLFEIQGAPRMAFKGGTSLSKVFSAIQRFSEDVDVTIDYRTLEDEYDPFGVNASRNKTKEFSERLRKAVATKAKELIVPALEVAASSNFGKGTVKVRIDGSDGEKVRVAYPSALDSEQSYVAEEVLIEFGGRNVVDPNESHTIKSYLDGIPNLEFPTAHVIVLSPERTFWEKATLIHAECHRPEGKALPSRLSRHWYDLDQLAASSIGNAALGNRKLLEDVVRIKEVFYRRGWTNHKACLQGQLRLVPDQHTLDAIRADFSKMIRAGMFYEKAPHFDRILRRLGALERAINQVP